MEITFLPPLLVVRGASWDKLRLTRLEAGPAEAWRQEFGWLCSNGSAAVWRTSGWLATDPAEGGGEVRSRLREIAGRSPLLVRLGWTIEGGLPGDLVLARLRLPRWRPDAPPHVSLLAVDGYGRACALEQAWLPAPAACSPVPGDAGAESVRVELLARHSVSLQARLSLSVLAVGPRRTMATLPARTGAAALAHLDPAGGIVPGRRLDWDEEESLTPVRTPSPETISGAAQEPAVEPAAASDAPHAAPSSALELEAVPTPPPGDRRTSDEAAAPPAPALPQPGPHEAWGRAASGLPQEEEAWLTESVEEDPEEEDEPTGFEELEAPGPAPHGPTASPPPAEVERVAADPLAAELQRLLTPIAGPAALSPPSPMPLPRPGEGDGEGELEEVEAELDALLKRP